jgi:hypothetical protein
VRPLSSPRTGALEAEGIVDAVAVFPSFFPLRPLTSKTPPDNKIDKAIIQLPIIIEAGTEINDAGEGGGV